MFASATSGDRPNNSKFSGCSIGNISNVLDAIEENKKRNCFSGECVVAFINCLEVSCNYMQFASCNFCVKFAESMKKMNMSFHGLLYGGSAFSSLCTEFCYK